MTDAAGQRLLPFDIDVGVVRVVGATQSKERPPNPPTFAELVDSGAIAPESNPDLSFNGAEQSLAHWLRQRGLKVLSVQRRLGVYERTPDAALPEYGATVELKRTTASVSAIVRGCAARARAVVAGRDRHPRAGWRRGTGRGRDLHGCALLRPAPG